MTDKTRIQIEEMKKQTIGVEIEMAEITRETACRTVAKYFGTENTVTYYGGGYDAWRCKDNQGRTWAIMRDSSIRNTTDSKKAELVTPILTYDDIPTLQEIVRQLRHKGAKSNPYYGCGVHIHIGANGHNASTLRNLANIMASHEQLLIKALNLDSRRVYNYCDVVNRTFLTKVNNARPKMMAKLADIWYKSHGDSSRYAHYNNSRYHMLNLHATFTKGTVEFRLFQFDNPTEDRKGGLHAGQLKSYIQLCLALSQTAKGLRGASSKPIQTENPRFAMRTWLIRLGFVGEEFQTARDLFTKRLDGDTAFRFGRTA